MTEEEFQRVKFKSIKDAIYIPSTLTNNSLTL